MSIERSRYHDILTYCTEEQLEQVYRTYIHRIVGIAHILHDKDVWTEDDQNKNPEHKANALKEAHRHIILRTVCNISTNTVVRWFKRFQWRDDKEQLITVRGEGVRYDELGSKVDYLIHLNDPDKHQYKKSEIKKLGDTTFLRIASTCFDDSLVIIDRLNDYSYPIRQLVAEYGKDFVYHYRAYRDVAIAIREQETLMLQVSIEGNTTVSTNDQYVSERAIRQLLAKIYDNYDSVAKLYTILEKGD